MDSSISYNDDERIESRLPTQALEMAYHETLRNADLITKDESARRLRLRILLLENENDDLHEQLSLADDRIDELEQEAEDVRTQLEFAQEESGQHEAELRSQSRELKTLKAELESMNGVNEDTIKVLTEKLALSRELAFLKPEFEHLRSQATYQQTVLSEKLALQRQVSTLEVELETEKRASKRAMEKNKNKERELQLQQQVHDLQKELVREKRERENSRKEAEREIEVGRRAFATEMASNTERELNLEQKLDTLQKDLAREKREREKTRTEAGEEIEVQRSALKRATEKASNREKELELQQQLDELRGDLAREKREGERVRMEVEKDLEAERRASKCAVEKGSNNKGPDLEIRRQLDELQFRISQEKLATEKARKEADKHLKASETQGAVLESKLEQMRTKLRATKEELKECETELGKARMAGVKVGTSSMQVNDAPSKISRKRAALEMSTDIAIGTPDGVAFRGKRPVVKRGRMEQTMVGEKSLFSITPYLNRTMSIAPESPGQNQHNAGDAGTLDKVQAADTSRGRGHDGRQLAEETSPSAASKPKAKTKPIEKKAPVQKKVLGDSQQVANSKKPPQKKSRSVGTLEKVTEEEIDENTEPDQPHTTTNSAAVKPVAAKASKPSMKSVEEAEPKKKKRKLLGAGKTLFDEEDGEATKRSTKTSLGPPRVLGKGGLTGPKGGMKPGMAAASGFGAFSPLKKDRRGLGASFLS